MDAVEVTVSLHSCFLIRLHTADISREFIFRSFSPSLRLGKHAGELNLALSKKNYSPRFSLRVPYDVIFLFKLLNLIMMDKRRSSLLVDRRKKCMLLLLVTEIINRKEHTQGSSTIRSRLLIRAYEEEGVG